MLLLPPLYFLYRLRYNFYRKFFRGDNLRVGIDAVLIPRMERSLKSEHFKARVFGELELAELEQRKFSPKTAAACFAAKEAFAKAIGCGIMTKFTLRDVQLLHRANGQPFLKLSRRARRLVGRDRPSVSVTHEGDLAIVVVIM